MVMLVLAAIVAVIILVHVFLPKTYHWPSYIRAIKKIPGPPTLPYIGTKAMISVDTEDFLPMVIRLFNEYGPVVELNLLGTYIVLIENPDDAEIIMSGKQHIEKSDDYELFSPWLGTGLLTSTGAKWFKHRKMLTPSFHFGILEDYIEIFHRNANILIDILKSHGSKSVEINPLVSLCTLDIICETAMGTKVNAQKGEAKEYITGVLNMSKYFQLRQVSPWLYRPWVFNISPLGIKQRIALRTVHGFTEKVIKERREAYRSTQQSKKGKDEDSSYGVKKRNSLLDQLLTISETTGELTQTEIREEVDTFMFEGHDTTSAALTWALFELGHQPDIQRKIQEEIDSIYEGSDRMVTSKDLVNMKYLERVLKEVLRLYPSVPLIGRNLEKTTTLSGYEVPEGTNIGIAVFYMHRNPVYFPKPDVFDPDRFLPDNISKKHPFSYIPFSAGPRNCIGQKFAMMEEKIILSQIFRYLNVTTITKREDVKMLAELVLRPKDNIQLIFTPRNC